MLVMVVVVVSLMMTSKEFGDDGSINKNVVCFLFCYLNYVRILPKLLVFVWIIFCNWTVLNE